MASIYGSHGLNARETTRLTLRRYRPDDGSSARGTFIIEALLLLVCVVLLAAAAMVIFTDAAQMAERSTQTDRAIVLAQSQAERFSADPAAVTEPETTDGLTVTCDVQEQEAEAGIIYEATINVVDAEHDNEPVYTLTTMRYASDAEVADAKSATTAAPQGVL